MGASRGPATECDVNEFNEIQQEVHGGRANRRDRDLRLKKADLLLKQEQKKNKPQQQIKEEEAMEEASLKKKNKPNPKTTCETEVERCTPENDTRTRSQSQHKKKLTPKKKVMDEEEEQDNKGTKGEPESGHGGGAKVAVPESALESSRGPRNNASGSGLHRSRSKPSRAALQERYSKELEAQRRDKAEHEAKMTKELAEDAEAQALLARRKDEREAREAVHKWKLLESQRLLESEAEAALREQELEELRLEASRAQASVAAKQAEEDEMAEWEIL